MTVWQPIETAPKNNKCPLWLARFNDDGTMQSFDYNGSWERESESWEMPEVYYFWASENGNVEEPSHWAYQPGEFCTLISAPSAPRIPEGWKLVPTAESRHPGIYKMLSALHAVDNTPGASEWASYAAFLAAAPEAKP